MSAWKGNDSEMNSDRRALTESRWLFASVIAVLCASFLAIVWAAHLSNESVAVARITVALDEVTDERNLSDHIIHNLPGGVVRIDAETGLVLRANLGALELCGTRSLEEGLTVYPLLRQAGGSKEQMHRNDVFGDTWKETWQRRYEEGALIQACEALGHNLRISAHEMDGKPIYVVFIDPRES